MAARGVLAALAMAASSAAMLGDEPPFALKLVDEDIAQADNARCLAGTLPGYYFRPGSAENRTKFKMHFEGGGWCYTPEDCFYRLTSGGSAYPGWLGNSSVWPQLASDMVAPWGMMAWNDTDTAGWTSVWINYCDGSSWSSDRAEPVMYKGTPLWMRGRAILTAILADLDRHAGLLTSSTDVIISGTSAGGLATYLHAERIRSALPPTASLVAIPDAGFFIDEPNVHGVRSFRANVQTGWAMYNASLGVNQACIDHYDEDNAWRCFMAQYTAPFITRVPLYVLNSAVDEASMGLILEIGCKFTVNTTGDCNATQVRIIQEWRKTFLTVLNDYVFSLPPHANRAGAFITSCFQHEEVCRTQDWTRVRVGGATDQENFGAWLAGTGPGTTRRIDSPWPNPTCQTLPMHGPC